MKLYSEEPLFVKFSGAAKEWSEWDRVVVPNGKYHVQPPMRHRLVLKKAKLCYYPNVTDDGSTGVENGSGPLRLYQDMSKDDYAALGACGCLPHETFFLEATDARTLHTVRPHMSGMSSIDTERAVDSMRFASLEQAPSWEHLIEQKSVTVVPADPGTPAVPPGVPSFEVNPGGIPAVPGTPAYEIKHAPVRSDIIKPWVADYDSDAATFDLSHLDTNQIVLRVVDAEGHSLRELNQKGFIPADYHVTLQCQFSYQMYVQDIERPKHKRGGFTGYYKSAITDQHCN